MLSVIFLNESYRSNKMSLFTKLFKGIAKGSDDVLESKSTRKAAAEASQKAVSKLKTFSSGGLKTTSAIGSQGVTKATSGGIKAISADAAKSFAKGTGGFAKVGGKVVAGTAVASVPILGGVGLVNYYKNSMALTDEDRRLKFLIDQQERLNNGTADTGGTGNQDVENNPTALGNTGVGGSYNPFDLAYGDQKKDDKEDSSGMGLIGFAGLAAITAGGYYLYKKNKKSATKSTA